MPRRARLRAAGIALHVIQRGNNRSACFYSADDYTYYLEHLDRFARRFRCAIHAHVLMTNHVHLLLTPEDADGASLGMLTPHSESLALGASSASRREAYRTLVAEELDPRMTCAIGESTNGNVALGTARFQAEIETMLQRRARRGVPGRPRSGDAEQAGGPHVESKNVVCP